MKKLKLKIQDLENPSILTHREIKNILGGGDDFGSYTFGHTCLETYWNGTTYEHTELSLNDVELLQMNCPFDPNCTSMVCN